MKTWKILVLMGLIITVLLFCYNLTMLIAALQMPMDAIEMEPTGNVLSDLFADFIGALLGPVIGVAITSVMVQRFLGPIVLYLILSIILLVILLVK
jgi:hypothetical protein